MAMKMSQRYRPIVYAYSCILNKSVKLTSIIHWTAYTGRLNFLPWKTLREDQ